MSQALHAPPDQAALTSPSDGADAHAETLRVRLGVNSATPAEVLLRLATDPSVTVRAALALNPSAPPGTLGLLARDADTRVRTLLAHRLASLAPSLDDEVQSRLNEEALAALRHLIQDEAVRVRAAIAEAVKEMPDAPRALILCLAHDSAIEVSDPVIQLSPLLTEADLLLLLTSANSPAVARAVARRPCLTEAAADAIAASADAVAIQDLLANNSAQIREATLDALIARAADHIPWHEPLVRRPDLSPRAAQALSRIVANALLAELASRADLGAAVTSELRARLSARLAQSVTQACDSAPSDDPTLAEALAEARRLATSGRLTEAALLVVTSRGEAHMAGAMLAVAADVPYSAVHRAASLRSAKGLASLTWKAGFSMRTAVVLQTLLARLAPGALLMAGPGDTFPLAIEEMRWQIDFLVRKTP